MSKNKFITYDEVNIYRDSIVTVASTAEFMKELKASIYLRSAIDEHGELRFFWTTGYTFGGFLHQRDGLGLPAALAVQNWMVSVFLRDFKFLCERPDVRNETLRQWDQWANKAVSHLRKQAKQAWVS
jgi:hypothetical protein